MKWNPDETVTINKQGDVLPLKEALLSHFEITVVTKSLLKQAAQLLENEDIQELVAAGNEEKVKAYVTGRDLLDLIRDFGPWGRSHKNLFLFFGKCQLVFIRLQAV